MTKLLIIFYLLMLPVGYKGLKASGPPINSLLDQIFVVGLSTIWPISVPLTFLMFKANNLPPIGGQ